MFAMELPSNSQTPLVYFQLFLLSLVIVLELLFVYHFIHNADEFQENYVFKKTIIILFIIAVVIEFFMIILSIIEIADPNILNKEIITPGLILLFVFTCILDILITLVTTKTNTKKYKKDWKYALLAVVLSWILFFVMFITLGTLWKFDYAILSFFICLPMFVSNVVNGLASDNKVTGISGLLNTAFSILAAYVGIRSITANNNFWFT
jgi:hypothetical protein